MGTSNLTIRPATHDDIKYVVALAKRETDTIGFLPTAAYREYVERSGILLVLLNGAPCGFLVWRLSNGARVPTLEGRHERHLKIIQTCIQYDARRREHGAALVSRLLRIAARRKAVYVSLWCADDLEANRFWAWCGFSFAGSRVGGQRRGRIHNGWRFDLRSQASGVRSQKAELPAPYDLNKAPTPALPRITGRGSDELPKPRAGDGSSYKPGVSPRQPARGVLA